MSDPYRTPGTIFDDLAIALIKAGEAAQREPTKTSLKAALAMDALPLLGRHAYCALCCRPVDRLVMQQRVFDDLVIIANCHGEMEERSLDLRSTLLDYQYGLRGIVGIVTVKWFVPAAVVGEP